MKIKPGIYQHFKKERDGEKMLYEVLGTAEHTKTGWHAARFFYHNPQQSLSCAV